MAREKAEQSRSPGAELRWTGHALVDVGVAGVCAFARKRAPEEVTLDDLDRVADYIEEHYYGGKLGTYLTCVFMNSSFVQPNEGAESRAEFIRSYVRAHRAEPAPEALGLRCAFSGGPATSLLVRTHFPMFSGEGVFNFRPAGTTAVPCAGPFIVALMFLPLASRRSEGRLLAVHADDPALTLRFARTYLEDNRRLIGLPMPRERAATHAGYDREQPQWDTSKKSYKYADAKGPRSLVVNDLAKIAVEAAASDARPHLSALTVYLLSNSGQGPSLAIFQVPAGVASFVLKAGDPETRQAWQAISKRFRPLKEDEAEDGKPRRKAKEETPIAGKAGWSRNPAFEDLCAIFDAGFTDRGAAGRWLRRYVLGRLERDADRGPEALRYGATDARSWKLTDLFLTEVLGMKPARIEAVRKFADKIAAYIQKKGEKKLYKALVFDRLSDVRRALLTAQRATMGDTLLFGLDEYATVWLHEDADEYLVRDLLCIRVVEELNRLGFERPEEMTSDDAPETRDPKEGRA